MAASAPITELTVTCNQCGSASLDRLDRREYRCRHCGAITVLSENDADRIERLLRDALAKQQMYRPQVVGSGGFGAPDVPLGKLPAIVVGVVAGFALLTALVVALAHHANPTPAGSNYNYSQYVPPKSIPASQVTLSPLQWIGAKDGLIPSGEYHALLYNHSGSTIDVPDFQMTFFPGGMKGDTAMYGHDVTHLLPGEYTHVTFRTLDKKNVDARYEVDSPSSIRSSSEELLRLPLEQPQLVRQEGRDSYDFVGVVRNTSNRALSYATVGVTLYGPDHQLLGGGSGASSSLRPGEKSIIHAAIEVEANAPPVRSYEYLVDAALERRP